MRGVTIRPLGAAGLPQLTRLFYAAVHQGTGDFYTPRQRHAWAPMVPRAAIWQQRLAGQMVLTARRHGRLFGFMTLMDDGCIDFAYVAPNAVGQGIGGQLFANILAEARHRGLARLHTQASLAARPFFLARGFRQTAEQSIDRRGIALTNFAMERRLN